MKNIHRKILLVCFTSLLLLIGCTGSKYSHDPAYLKCKVENNYNHCMSAGGQLGCDPSSRDICMFALAVNRSDASICDEIDSTVPTFWPFTQSTTSSHLREANQTYAQLCRNEVMISNDRSVCDPPASPALEVACSEYALLKADLGICDMLAQNDKDRCYINIIYRDYQNISDWSICGNLSAECEFCRVDCYSFAAVETANISYCDTLRSLKPQKGWDSEIFTEEHCYKMLAVSKPDSDICYNVKAPDECLAYTAESIYSKTSDYQRAIGVCQNITNETMKLGCMTEIDRMKENP